MKYPSDAKQAEYSRTYRERHPERVREIARNRTARMTPEERWARWLWKCHKLRPGEYEEIWTKQDGCCYLCEEELERGKVHIDHNHSCCREGRSCILCRRGLACRGCNWIVGWADELPGRLRLIAANLEKSGRTGDYYLGPERSLPR